MLTLAKKFVADKFFGAQGNEIKLGTELVQKLHTIKCNWKYSRDGGAVGDISLKDEQGDALSLPAGCIIRSGLIVVKTLTTSGGSATLAFKTASAGDIKAATAVASFTAGAKFDTVPVFTAATAIALAAATTPKLTVAVAALTAGEIDVWLDCVFQEP